MKELIVDIPLENIYKASVLYHINKRIKGTAKITMSTNNLYIDFVANNTPVFRYTEFNIWTKIQTGLQAKDLAFIATNQYKKYILSKYFR